MLFRLATGTTSTATTGLALVRQAATDVAAMFVAGNSISGRQLDFQLNDFIPLFICPITFRNGQQFAQPTTIVVGWRRRGQIDGRVFWV
ncbi:MAG: hypothetical protein WAV95_07420 [Azonexus sp.]